MSASIEVEGIKQDVIAIKASVDRIEQRLFVGNGGLPLMTRIEIVEGDVGRLKSTWNSVNKFLLGLTTAVILATGGFVWTLLTGAVTLVSKKP